MPARRWATVCGIAAWAAAAFGVMGCGAAWPPCLLSAADSPACRAARVSEWRDIVYADRDGAALLFDLYLPPDHALPNAASPDAALPLLIIVHGGFWTGGQRGIMSGVARDLASEGFAAATIDYRLVDDAVKFPAPVVDVLAAVRFFREQADDYGIDPRRIALVGASAGAHLALLAGMTDRTRAFDPDRPEDESPGVQAIVNLYGPTDFTVDPATAAEWQVEVVEYFLGTSLETAGELPKRASPIAYARPDGPPILTIHGTIDAIVPVDQARRFASALDAAGQPNEFIEIPWLQHASANAWDTPAGQWFLRPAIVKFLSERMPQ